MAHFILEYSANLSRQELALKDLFKKLHDAAAATGIYPLPGLRSRAHCADDFWVADGNPDFAFIHLNFRIGPGRSDAEKTRTFDILRDVLLEHLDTLYNARGIALSFEITELPAELRHNQNGIRRYMS